MISIHAPREGSDPRGALTSRERVISIHAPREGSDLRERRQKGGAKIFQSTLPARGATTACQGSLSTFCISIHAPREGSDEQRGHNRSPLYHFNPRSPRGERRRTSPPLSRWICISIHAPREGSDCLSRINWRDRCYFNPRSPRGERHITFLLKKWFYLFQSTLPARGATFFSMVPMRFSRISIHAPREGSDSPRGSRTKTTGDFNPRSPRGERLAFSVNLSITPNFNPRSPRGERLR